MLGAVGLSRQVILQRLVQVRNGMFGKYLLFTNTGICMASSGFGDYLQQQYERIRGRATCWDSIRFVRILGSAAVIGPSCHFWYLWLDRRFPGTSMATICRKVLLDQLIFSPINISLFLIVIGLMEGLRRREIWEELQDKGWTLFKAEWMVWPPAQFVNFYFLPTRYRVLFDSTVSLFFDYYYSYVKFCKKDNIVESDQDCDISVTVNTDSAHIRRQANKDTGKLILSHHRWKTYMYMYMDEHHDSLSHDD